MSYHDRTLAPVGIRAARLRTSRPGWPSSSRATRPSRAFTRKSAACAASGADLLKKTYKNLQPWETVQVARHPERPMASDYLDLAFDEFVELHGDRCFGDDRAMLTGFAKLDEFKVLFVGHQKGRTVKERTACNFGCAHPEGYRKALQKMELARQVRYAGRGADRHPRRVPGHRRRRARAGF